MLFYQTGDYVCPTTGLYLFTTQLRTAAGDYGVINIKTDGQVGDHSILILFLIKLHFENQSQAMAGHL